MRSPVQEDFAPDVRSAFVDNRQLILGLDEAPRIGRRAHSRNARGQATSLGIVLTKRRPVLFIQGSGSGQQRNLDAGADHVDVFANRVGLPVAGEIRTAVGGARRGSGGWPVGVPPWGCSLASPAELQVLRFPCLSR